MGPCTVQEISKGQAWTWLRNVQGMELVELEQIYLDFGLPFLFLAWLNRAPMSRRRIEKRVASSITTSSFLNYTRISFSVLSSTLSYSPSNSPIIGWISIHAGSCLWIGAHRSSKRRVRTFQRINFRELIFNPATFFQGSPTHRPTVSLRKVYSFAENESFV